MKKVLKVIGYVLLGVFILGTIMKNAMKSTYENSFAYQVAIANRGCPIPLALGKGSVNSIELRDGFLVYKVSYDNEYGHFLTNVEDEKTLKEGILLNFLCINAQELNQGNILMDVLIAENYGMKVIITESMDGYREYTATVEDIKEFREKIKLNPHEAFYRMIEINMEAEREQLPLVLEVGMTMTDYRLEDENIVVVIEMDEEMYEMEALYGVRDEIKKSLSQDILSDPTTKSMFDMCKVSHTGFGYRYIGKQTGRYFDIIFSSDEIRCIVQTPPVLNIR